MNLTKFEIQDLLNKAFDAGFSISTERFNAEFQNEYGLFDEDDIKKYKELKLKSIHKLFSALPTTKYCK